MAYNAGLHEILTTRLWDILPMALQSYRQRIEANMMGHIPFVMERENDIKPYLLSASGGFAEKVYIGDAERIQWRNELDEEDRIINVITMNGPVTRGGGACSYGSKEIRDMLMEAAGQPQIMGHIFLIDSPGGSAFSKYDFEQGINAVRDAGQKSIACIDGLCCSAAYALASLCDEIYFTHPNNELGCIGTMASFMLSAHGDENSITKERYVELYAEGSPYKNREFRAAAEGDFSLLEADLQRSADDFKALVRERRPGVTDEQLLGDTYLAGEVIGSLVDGQKDFSQCIDRMLELCGYEVPNNTPEPSAPQPAAPSTEEPEADSKDDTLGGLATEQTVTEYNTIEQTQEFSDTNNVNQTEMNKQYAMIQNALGEPELCSDSKNALYLNEAQCDVLNANLENLSQRSDALDTKMAEIVALNARIAEMEKNHAEALEAIKAEHAQAVENLNTEKVAEMDALKAEHTREMEAKDAAMTEKENELNATIAELQGKLTEATASVEAKEAEIKELENAGTEQPVVEAPADNNLEAETKADGRICKPGMTAKERREALAAKFGRPRC